MSQTKTGSGVGAVAALIAVAVVGVLAFQAVKRNQLTDDEDKERVVLSVTFRPDVRREHPVHVIASVGRVDVFNELVTHSPLNVNVDVPRGVQVLLSAQQFGGQIGDLDCVIQADGVVVDSNHTTDEGSIRCWHNRGNI